MSDIIKIKMFDIQRAIPMAQSFTLYGVIVTLLAAWVIRTVISKVYVAYFGPLSAIPTTHPLSPWTYLWRHYHTIIANDRFLVIDKFFREKGTTVLRQAPNEIITCDPEITRQIFTAKWDKDKMTESFVTNGIPNSFSTIEHSKGMAKRRLILPLYNLSSIQAFSDVIMRHINESLEDIEAASKKGQPIEIMNFGGHLILDIIGEMMMDTDLGCLEAYVKGSTHPVVKAINNWPMYCILTTATPSWFIYLLKQIPHKGLQEFMTCNNVLVSTCKQPTLDAMERGAKPDRKTLVHRLTAADDEETSPAGRWTMQEIISEISAEFFAGMETTGITLTWTLWHLVKNPDVAKKLQEEVDAIDWGANDKENVSSIMSLAYLNAVVKESLRLKPPVNAASFRVVQEPGMMMNEHFIPAGTFVGPQIWTMHRLKSVWGEDAEEFRPERWLEDMTHEQTSAWQPFSVGGRSCPGMNLALTNAKVIIAMMLRKFDVSAAARTTDESMRAIDFGTTKPASGECWLDFKLRS